MWVVLIWYVQLITQCNTCILPNKLSSYPRKLLLGTMSPNPTSMKSVASQQSPFGSNHKTNIARCTTDPGHFGLSLLLKWTQIPVLNLSALFQSLVPISPTSLSSYSSTTISITTFTSPMAQHDKTPVLTLHETPESRVSSTTLLIHSLLHHHVNDIPNNLYCHHQLLLNCYHHQPESHD